MNNINPLRLLQLREQWKQFQERHPKFPAFLNAASRTCLEEGTVIDVTITSPDVRRIGSNLRLTAQDIQLLREIGSLSSRS